MSELRSNQSIRIELKTAADTELLGLRLASLVETTGLVVLCGPLGAGKTTFARGAGQALGVDEVVNSPTFTMLNEYSSGRIPFYHLDLYRLKEEGDLGNAGGSANVEMLEAELDELLTGQGLVLIEWPDALWPYIKKQDYVSIDLNYSQPPLDKDQVEANSCLSGRSAFIQAHGASACQVIEQLSNVYFS